MSTFEVTLGIKLKRRTKTLFRETEEDYLHIVKETVDGRNYLVAKHDNEIERVIILNNDNRHVYTCKWEDIINIRIDGEEETKVKMAHK